MSALQDELAAVLRQLGLDCDSLRALMRDELRRARVETEQDVLIDLPGLAEIIGRTPAATKQYLMRPTGAELAALALRVGGRRRWRKVDVLAWLEGQRRTATP